MKALIGLLLLVFGHDVSSVIHSKLFFYTASSGLSTFPEFVIVQMVDEVQIGYYDSNTQRIITKQDWAEQANRDTDPDYLERDTENRKGNQQVFKANMGILKQRFNQTGGVHVYQRMDGCEWDDEDGTTEGYHQYGYDGEDFISWDLKTLTWVAPVHQALTTKHKWEGLRGRNQYLKNYYAKECVDWLKKYLAYGKSTLQRTERPRVSLLQRSPSSPVVCHATGFYPNRVVVFWRRDGQELHEQVDPGEVLPNHDGTFQVSVDLDLTAVPQEDWGRGQSHPCFHPHWSCCSCRCCCCCCWSLSVPEEERLRKSVTNQMILTPALRTLRGRSWLLSTNLCPQFKVKS
ncbi:major histocompatibility complex class I-related gene protein isoform X6 [Gadus morhua]|uniref:major histocompatibility complex class I-related gene protein isoform X6 n=1 Tax=Gadus morhua TaxID=8049 RepID=UPI0011B3B2F6|nr:major histocompatibility complex class I-related gene protein-like isoform X6 [Gadus morhua]